MPFFKRGAFSSFELLCIIVIFAILSSIGVRYLGDIQEKNCLLYLKARLASAQHALSTYYHSTFMLNLSSDSVRAREIFISALFQGGINKQCVFELKGKQMIAHVGEKNLTFTLSPPTFALNPKISCNIKDPLCKEMSDQILDK